MVLDFVESLQLSQVSSQLIPLHFYDRSLLVFNFNVILASIHGSSFFFSFLCQFGEGSTFDFPFHVFFSHFSSFFVQFSLFMHSMLAATYQYPYSYSYSYSCLQRYDVLLTFISSCFLSCSFSCHISITICVTHLYS